MKHVFYCFGLCALYLLPIVGCSGPQNTNDGGHVEADMYRWLPAVENPTQEEHQQRFKTLDKQQMQMEAHMADVLEELASADDATLEAHLQEAFKAHSEETNTLIAGYSELFDAAPEPVLATATLVRLGDAYFAIGEFIHTSPIPARLNTEQRLIYEDMLLDLSDQVQGKADGHYKVALAKATELQVPENDLLKRARERTTLVQVSPAYGWLPSPSSDEQAALQERFKQLDAEQMVLEFELYAGLEMIRSSSNPEKVLQDLLKKHADASQEFVKNYHEIVQSSDDPVLATAVMVRTGDAFFTLAEFVANSPVPPGFSDEQVLVYQDALLGFASQFESKAKQFYEVATTKGVELGVPDNPILERAQKRLQMKF